MAIASIKSRRTASKEARRQQLIEATIKCISKRGIGSTTLGDVAKEAGLSQGIVNLHFQSKDNLFNETLRFLAEEYKSLFEKTLDKAGPGAADKLLALMELDLKPSVCDQRKLAVWFGFWGEVKAMPTYRKMCNEYDRIAAALRRNHHRGQIQKHERGKRRRTVVVTDERALAILPDQPQELGPACRTRIRQGLFEISISESLLIRTDRANRVKQERNSLAEESSGIRRRVFAALRG
jgi:AcrR family transcriptional regulator